MMLPVEEHWTGSLGWKAETRQNPLCQLRTVWNQADDSDLGSEREVVEASSHFGACLLHCSLTERGRKMRTRFNTFIDRADVQKHNLTFLPREGELFPYCWRYFSCGRR